MYSILVLIFKPKLGTSVSLFHSASYKTSKIKLLKQIGSLISMLSGRILSVFMQLGTFHDVYSLSRQIQCCPAWVYYIDLSWDELITEA